MTGNLFHRYLSRDAAVLSLLGGDFRDHEFQRQTVALVQKRRVAPALIDVLQTYNSSLGPLSTAQLHSLKIAAQESSVFAITGQQCGLFLGPLYTLYKAFGAIAAARVLSERQRIPVVPLFWIQSEDHSLKETSSIRYPSAEGGIRHLSLSKEQRDEGRISIEHQLLGERVTVALDQLTKDLAHFPEAGPFLEQLRASYTPQTSFTTAFAKTLRDITAEEGLLFFNPRSPGVASLAQPLFQRALDQVDAISSALLSRGKKIHALGLEEQVPIVERSPLFFVHDERPDGPRYRLQKESSGWQYIGRQQKLSDRELRDLVASHPERLSSSALLRPILQDSLFPTSVYLGGPGEVAYLAQMRALYPIFELAPPIVLPRPRFLVIEPKVQRFLAALNLTAEQVVTHSHSQLMELLTRRAGSTLTDSELFTSQVWQELGSLKSRIATELGKVDTTLLSSTNRTFEKITPQVESLLERYRKALTLQDSVTTERLERTLALLRPDGEEQERVLGACYFLARYGEGFTNKLKAGMSDPFGEKELFLEL